MRECLDREGFHKVKIIVSSGFGPAKCRLMAEADAPVDVIGTGSYLPTKWTETYATADVVEYEDRKSTSLTPVTNAHHVCSLLLETTKTTTKSNVITST